MKRFLMGCTLTLAALFAVTFSSIPASAAGTDVVWKTVLLPWGSYGAGTAAAGDSLKWQHITDENDSTRTAFVSTADWAWDGIEGIGVAGGVTAVAYLTCGCQTNNLAAGNDSIMFMVEKRAPNGKVNYNATMVAAVNSVLYAQGAGSSTQAIFRGQLHYDSDAAETVNLISPGDDFRLVLKGDQGSTTPALGKCSLWITYPSRRASQ